MHSPRSCARFCEKHSASVEAPDYRYMLNALAADWSGPSLWLSAFGDVVRVAAHAWRML